MRCCLKSLDEFYFEAKKSFGIERAEMEEILKPFITPDDELSNNVMEQFKARIAPCFLYHLITGSLVSFLGESSEFKLKNVNANDNQKVFLDVVRFLIERLKKPLRGTIYVNLSMHFQDHTLCLKKIMRCE